MQWAAMDIVGSPLHGWQQWDLAGQHPQRQPTRTRRPPLAKNDMAQTEDIGCDVQMFRTATPDPLKRRKQSRDSSPPMHNKSHTHPPSQACSPDHKGPLRSIDTTPIISQKLRAMQLGPVAHKSYSASWPQLQPGAALLALHAAGLGLCNHTRSACSGRRRLGHFAAGACSGGGGGCGRGGPVSGRPHAYKLLLIVGQIVGDDGGRVLQEQRPCDASDQLGQRKLHARQRRRREAQRGQRRVVVRVQPAQEGRRARHLLGELKGGAQVGVVVNQLVAPHARVGLLGELVGPGGDVRRQQRQLGPQVAVGEQAGGHDEEVKRALRLALGRGDAHLIAALRELQRLPVGTQVQVEVGVRARPVVRVVGGRLVEAQEVVDAGILGGVRQVRKVLQEAGLLHEADGVDARQALAAHKHVHLARAGAQRVLRVVKRAGAASQDGDALAAQRVQVHHLRGVRVQVGRHRLLDEVGRVPLATALDACGQDHLARVQLRRCAGRSVADRHTEQGGHHRAAGVRGGGRTHVLDALHAHAVAHGDVQNLAVPHQVRHPHLLGDLVQRRPRVRPKARLVVRLEGEGGQAKVEAGEVLGRAQRDHARVRHPGALCTLLVFVQAQHVGDALAHEAVRHRQPALAAAHDQGVVDVRAGRGARKSSGHGVGARPWLARPRQDLQVLLDLEGVRLQATGNLHWLAGHCEIAHDWAKKMCWRSSNAGREQ
mmetsp:Transcript_23304/g.59575  ORF Transcript_23304/g.59575 Transcript_23304/m.59575 type:complete len:713 (-) Transcript_23304:48-2186(-)